MIRSCYLKTVYKACFIPGTHPTAVYVTHTLSAQYFDNETGKFVTKADDKALRGAAIKKRKLAYFLYKGLEELYLAPPEDFCNAVYIKRYAETFHDVNRIFVSPEVAQVWHTVENALRLYCKANVLELQVTTGKFPIESLFYRLASGQMDRKTITTTVLAKIIVGKSDGPRVAIFMNVNINEGYPEQINDLDSDCQLLGLPPGVLKSVRCIDADSFMILIGEAYSKPVREYDD